MKSIGRDDKGFRILVERFHYLEDSLFLRRDSITYHASSVSPSQLQALDKLLDLPDLDISVSARVLETHVSLCSLNFFSHVQRISNHKSAPRTGSVAEAFMIFLQLPDETTESR